MSRWLLLAACIVALDQGTKYLATGMLELHTPVPLLPFLNLTLIYNPGAAFSFLSEAGGWQRWLFISLSIGVSIVLIGWLRTIPRDQFLLPMALTLVLGGALGNVWDRIVLGAVIDFIDLHYQGWHWPTFNLADSSIALGAFLLLITMFSTPREEA